MKPQTILMIVGVLLCTAFVAFFSVDAASLIASIGLLGVGMAAVTTEQYVERSHVTHRGKLPVAASLTLYGGTMAFADANGFGTGVAAGNAFKGIVVDTVVGGTANGDESAEVFEGGKFILPGSGFTQADVGVKLYATDNYTLTKTATSNSYVGTLNEFISATEVRVAIDTQAA